MLSDTKIKKHIEKNSEGSSLVIALFFFMVCALLCAGILFLARSTTRGVSNTLAKAQDFVEPEGVPTITLIPSPTPSEGDSEDEVKAINSVYDKLYYDYYYSMTAVQNGGQYIIQRSKNPKDISYEIFSYINDNIYKKMDNPSDHVNNQDDFNYPILPDEFGNLDADFIITLEGMPPVKVIVSMTGIQPTKAGQYGNDVRKSGIDFNTLKMTVVTAVEGSTCTYMREFEYVVPDNGKFVIWYDEKTAFQFVIKPKT